MLEQIAGCRTAIFDKTGTLTYGEPKLTEQLIAQSFDPKEVLTLVAALERYSKHPLARAIIAAAKEAGIELPEATDVGEAPGQGLRGTVAGRAVQVISRNQLAALKVAGSDQLPQLAGGLECVVMIDERYAAAFRFRDAPRAESRSFVSHLGPKHQFARVMLVSGDRESEVQYLSPSTLSPTCSAAGWRASSVGTSQTRQAQNSRPSRCPSGTGSIRRKPVPAGNTRG